MHRIMDAIFYIVNYTDIKNQLKTIVDEISERTAIRTLPHNQWFINLVISFCIQ